MSESVDQLSVVDSSRVAVMGASAPDYAACAGAAYGSASYPLIGATVGTYFCVRTDQHHYAEAKLTKTATTSNHNINLDFTTWK